MRKYTIEEAMALFDLYGQRIFAWTIVLGIGPNGKTDGRSKRAKEQDRILRDLWLNKPGFSEFIGAAMAGRDLITMWPEEQQETVRFRVHHMCPREINEPLSPQNMQERREIQGENDWPDFILEEYAIPATVEDHPPPIPASSLYNSWRDRADQDDAAGQSVTDRQRDGGDTVGKA